MTFLEEALTIMDFVGMSNIDELSGFPRDLSEVMTVDHKSHCLGKRSAIIDHRLKKHFPEIPLRKTIAQYPEVEEGSKEGLDFIKMNFFLSPGLITVKESAYALLNMAGAVYCSYQTAIALNKFINIHPGDKVKGAVGIIS